MFFALSLLAYVVLLGIWVCASLTIVFFLLRHSGLSFVTLGFLFLYVSTSGFILFFTFVNMKGSGILSQLPLFLPY